MEQHEPRVSSVTPASESDRRASPGVESIARLTASDGEFGGTEFAEDVAADIVDCALVTPSGRGPSPEVTQVQGGGTDEIAALQAQVEQLQVQLECAESESEALRKKARAGEDAAKQTESIVETLQVTNQAMAKRVAQCNEAIAEQQDRLDQELQDKRALEQRLEAAQAEGQDLQRAAAAAGEELQKASADRSALERECAELRAQAQKLGAAEPASPAPAPASVSRELPAEESSQESQALQAAFKKMSLMNKELGEVYSELAFTRTELLKATADKDVDEQRAAEARRAEADEKQTLQIADLVSDIRHLQLDLEYHQQKLDSMISEKQQMMKEMKRSQEQLAEANQKLEEKEQVIKHAEVDLDRLQQTQAQGKAGGDGAGEAPAVEALRAEVSAKDSALIVSHYELHKEKLLRERLEQKNLKLMERMQKLMMVVESMRRENVGLERDLQGRERQCEDKEQQLRELKKKNKAAKGQTPRGGKHLDSTNSAAATLPSLDRPQRSIDSAGGQRSGLSTPRLP